MVENALWVVCSVAEGRVSPASYELLGKARQLADSRQQQVVGLVSRGAANVGDIIYAGADVAVAVETDAAVWQDDAATGTVLYNVLRTYSPDIVLFVADIRSRCIAPWIAAKMETGLTADCTGLCLDEGGFLLQSRPAFGGGLTADILCYTRPQMATVRPGIFLPPNMDRSRQGCIVTLCVDPPTIRIHRRAFERLPNRTALQDAEIIVAGGRGIGSRAGFHRLEQLAELLGGSVGATRSAVNAGFARYDQQIGQTGVIVRPRVYLAFGICGLVQHVVGMSGAEYIVAVNRDSKAPIFNYCDYGIVSRWEPVVDRMIRILEEHSCSG